MLSNASLRRQYDAVCRGELPENVVGTQSVEDHAHELFERACFMESRQEFAEALKFFSAAIRVGPNARYLLRAARCALAAGALDQAIENAKKSSEIDPANPSTFRVMADVYRAMGELGEAEKALLSALAIKTENDILMRELERDLEKVRELSTRI